MANFYAEFDTDRIIRDKYFTDYSYKGVIVEVGAATPEFLSMTRHFKENDWRCIHIEPNPEFVKLHQQFGNEIYQYACADFDQDNIDFTVVSLNDGSDPNKVSDHSFSSIEVKKEYIDLHKNWYNNLNKKKIKVNCRKLDTIVDTIDIDNIDILSIDTEGWEIEVMKGLTKIKPKLIILENLLSSSTYNDYMFSRGYNLSHIQSHNYFYEIN